MPRIVKVLNSSVVLVEDDQYGESIILQKGIGYGKKPGQIVIPDEEGRIFTPKRKEELSQLSELMQDIDPSFLEAAGLISDYAQAVLGQELDPKIFLALTDHLYFAWQRKKENLPLVNRMYWEIRSFYPREFKIGQYGLRVVKSVCGIDLGEEEAANIAFHVLNASIRKSDSRYDAGQATRLIKGILHIVELSLTDMPDEQSLHYSRFMTHIQFFIQRLVGGALIDDAESGMYQDLNSRYPRSMAIACKVRDFLEQQTHIAIPDEETAYLAIHIHRLMTKKR